MISGSPPHFLRGAGGDTTCTSSDIVFDGGFANKEEAESFEFVRNAIVPDQLSYLTANGKCYFQILG